MEKSVHNKSQCTILPNKENKTKKCALNSETEKWSFLPDSGQNDLVFSLFCLQTTAYFQREETRCTKPTLINNLLSHVLNFSLLT
ncbi:Uncharacterized protein APZ42_014908 [Daphnia magna]|uniref:Uncharacterized protein n=1 Tax=Daphnia magna TaxID=35525 RepID=A0A162NZG9_9CRUS|nr:Uncharacterized protein APZ42_014908 [Daphnia magna]